MEYEPGARPSFTEVLSELNSILADTLGILHRFIASSTGAGDGQGASSSQAPQPAVESGPQPSDPFQ